MSYYSLLVDFIKKWIYCPKAKLISLYRVYFFTLPLFCDISIGNFDLPIKVSCRLGKHLNIGFLIKLFFFQFAEFNLKAPSYSKTLHYSELPYSRAPTLFRSNWSWDRKNSSCVNVALEECKILTFLFNLIFYYWGCYY